MRGKSRCEVRGETGKITGLTETCDYHKQDGKMVLILRIAGHWWVCCGL